MTPSLELMDVVRHYGKGVRIGPISFSTDPGAFISLLGPSGCGKTTLLRCIAGFEPLDEGRLLINGRDFSAVPAHGRGIGLVFQNYALFPHLSVAENVAFGLRVQRVRRPDRERRVREALDLVGLSPVASRLPAQISGGQQQRVAIARSLVLEPSILLLDEPLSNLDYKLRLQMRRELLALQRRMGMTFIFVTHDQSEALALSDRIVVLSDGRIEQIGTPAEIYGSPKSYFVADFIGGANLLKIKKVISETNGEASVELESGDCLVVSGQRPVNSDAWVAIRPEQILPVDAENTGVPAAGVLKGRPLSRTFTGDRAELTVEIGYDQPQPTQVTCYIDPDRPIGETISLQVVLGGALLVKGSP